MVVAVLLLLTMAIPFPLCLFRMKKYGISFLKMIVIYLVFSGVGFAGASIGSMLAGGAIAGRRLYGLMIFDTVALLIMSKLLKIRTGDLGDFIAPPIMAVCACAKIDCLLNDCCKGFIMTYDGVMPIHFPSAIFEMVIWLAFVLLLLLLEKKKNVKTFLWPIALVWFGFARYFVDFFRGSEWEQKPFFFEMPAGRFWSVVCFLIGIVFLFYSFRKYYKKSPTVLQMLKAIFGINPAKNV